MKLYYNYVVFNTCIHGFSHTLVSSHTVHLLCSICCLLLYIFIYYIAHYQFVHFPTDTAVQVFMEIADCIRDKKKGYETTESRILRTWAFLFVFSLLISFFFGNYSVFNFLASYYLHWLCTIITCLVGAGSIVWVVTTISDAQILNGMEATLAEIRVLLKYNSLLRGTGNSDYKNDTGVTN